MDLSTVALPPVSAKPATLFVALELSKATWLVALHSPAADKVSLHRLAGGDVQELLTLIARKRDQAQEALACPVHVMSCYEAGYDGFWTCIAKDTAGEFDVAASFAAGGLICSARTQSAGLRCINLGSLMKGGQSRSRPDVPVQAPPLSS
jgi:hypothetical protein